MTGKNFDFHHPCFGRVYVCMRINRHFASDFDVMIDPLHDDWMHKVFKNCRKHDNDQVGDRRKV